jgi:hypothetical protein
VEPAMLQTFSCADVKLQYVFPTDIYTTFNSDTEMHIHAYFSVVIHNLYGMKNEEAAYMYPVLNFRRKLHSFPQKITRVVLAKSPLFDESQEINIRL